MAKGQSRVIGFSPFGPARADAFARRGEIYTLYLLDAYQRCGIGRRLLLASADDMAAAGFLSRCVWELAANPAQEFHERLGAVELLTRDISFAGRYLDEVCYLWPGLRRLEALKEH